MATEKPNTTTTNTTTTITLSYHAYELQFEQAFIICFGYAHSVKHLAFLLKSDLSQRCSDKLKKMYERLCFNYKNLQSVITDINDLLFLIKKFPQQKTKLVAIFLQNRTMFTKIMQNSKFFHLYKIFHKVPEAESSAIRFLSENSDLLQSILQKIPIWTLERLLDDLPTKLKDLMLLALKKLLANDDKLCTSYFKELSVPGFISIFIFDDNFLEIKAKYYEYFMKTLSDRPFTWNYDTLKELIRFFPEKIDYVLQKALSHPKSLNEIMYTLPRDFDAAKIFLQYTNLFTALKSLRDAITLTTRHHNPEHWDKALTSIKDQVEKKLLAYKDLFILRKFLENYNIMESDFRFTPRFIEVTRFLKEKTMKLADMTLERIPFDQFPMVELQPGEPVNFGTTVIPPDLAERVLAFREGRVNSTSSATTIRTIGFYRGQPAHSTADDIANTQRVAKPGSTTGR